MRLNEDLHNVEWIDVCPESDGGLPTPRIPSEMQGMFMFVFVCI